jgi:RHS repeat-associated protein
VNSGQTVAASYRYDPFGNLVSSSGSLASANVYRFSSKELHVNSGMYYYVHRFYDPSLQRWVNRDPVDEPGVPWKILQKMPIVRFTKEAENRYLFVKNEPISSTDPWGELRFAGCRLIRPPHPIGCCLQQCDYACFYFDSDGNPHKSIQYITRPRGWPCPKTTNALIWGEDPHNDPIFNAF